jgi:hypothetical protein
MCIRVTRDLYRHHMRTIYLEQCGITMGFDPTGANPIYNVNDGKDGMTGMPRRRGRPCAWPPARARRVGPPQAAF